jgi:tripartite-type tricarboxylate transporter receptor subunit TctC
MIRFSTRRGVLCGAAAAALATLGSPALAQSYPHKPIKWIVPYNAGGASDIVARVIGEALGNALGQRIVIDNRPGAGGTVGLAALAAAAPDGYTWATADNGGLFNNWYLFDKLPYGRNSFEYVAMTGRFPLVLAVHKDVPVRDMQQWAQWVRQQGGRISYGTPGVGSPHHLAMATLDELLGLQMLHVPYKGDSAAVVDLVGGQIQTMLMGVATARQYVKDDRLRFLAVNWSSRLSTMPDVPTFAEAGVLNFQVSAEQGLVAPAGTPKEIVQRINQELAKVLKTPAVLEKLETLGMYPVLKSPAEFRSYVATQEKAAGDIIQRKGIRLN